MTEEMTEAQRAEFDRKAALANQWARDAEARRHAELRTGRVAAVSTRPALASAVPASDNIVRPAVAGAPATPAHTIKEPPAPAPTSAVDPDEAVTARILAASFGAPPAVARSASAGPRKPVGEDEAVAHRILAARFGEAS